MDGEPRAIAPAGTIDGFLQGRLAAFLNAHLDRHIPSCSVVVTPGVVPHLLSAHNVRVPDLGVTCSPLLPGQTILPDPMLPIEILSPSNQAKTWSNIWAYTSIPGLREILILHSGLIGAEVLRRTPSGAWPAEPELVVTGDLVLNSVGLRIAMTDLYARTVLVR